ncbi:MAG: SDR family oxidoreductase [Actinobacteria bacterium]|nr:SDR family oxidoreductase [Actinomycetota bacterium]
MRLAGKVAVVTGAARERGIGRGIATCLAEEGCDVVVNDCSAEGEGLELVEELRAGGRRAIWHRADIGKREEVESLFEHAIAELGLPTVICANAGVAGWQPVVDVDEAHWRRLIDTNLIGTFSVCQVGARRLVDAGSEGRIIVTSSVHVQMPFPEMAIYGATKAGMRAMVDAAAVELAPHGITVNHIGPGWVKSAINDASPSLLTEEDVEATVAMIPAGRAADPRELGMAAAYLASEDAAYVTGEYLRVDGGLVVGKH